MREILLILFFSLLQINLYSQKTISYNDINILRDMYSIEKKTNAHNEDSRIPPCPIDTDIRKDFSCEKKYSIPDSVLINLYPFNVDSIVVYTPEKDCDSGRYNRLQAMKENDLMQFADMLYNYDFIEHNREMFLIHNITTCDRADMKLFFYDETLVDTLSIFFEDELQVRIDSTFEKKITNTYWGEPCEDRYEKLIGFFYEKYGFLIEKYSEEQNEIELIPIDKNNER